MRRTVKLSDEPAALPSGGSSLARCSRCDVAFVPRSTWNLYCGARCRAQAKQSSSNGRVRAERGWIANVSYRLARRALRRAGIDPSSVEALEALRGRGDVDGWRALVGLPPEARGRKRQEVALEALVAGPPWGAPVGDQPEHVAWGLSLDGLPLQTAARHVHGLVSRLVGADHTQVARWALAMPSNGRGGCGWGVVLFRRDDAARLAGHSERVRVGAVDVDLRLGPVVRLRAPTVPASGRYRVIIDAVTPVSHMIAGRTRPVTAPSVDTILRCAGDLLQRLGVSTGRMHVASVECTTSPERVDLGGHVGTVAGWVGRIEVECNAPAAWALTLARHAGLGGRVAYGLGRVRVEVRGA